MNIRTGRLAAAAAAFLAALAAAAPAPPAGAAEPKPAAKKGVAAKPAAAVDPDALRIGVDGTYPPFSEVGKGGKLGGFDVEIARALCEQIEAKCDLVPVGHWADVIPAVEAGRYDAVVASMSITVERLKRIDFTRKYYHVPAKFVAKKGAPLGGTAETLRGRRIGVQDGTTHADYLRARFAGVADVRAYATLPAALDDLAKGRVDLVMGDSLALQTSFLGTPAGEGYAFVGPAFTDPRWFGMGVGIALPKGNAALKAKLDGAIAALRVNGGYQKIAGKYFTFDIYGD